MSTQSVSNTLLTATPDFRNTMPWDVSRAESFLYGGRSQAPPKSNKCSFWPGRSSEAKQASGEKQAGSYQLPAEIKTRDSDGQRSKTNNTPTRDHNTQAKSSRRQPGRDSSTPATNTPRAHFPLPDPVPLTPPLTMHSFNRLASTVQQCPWMLGSDTNPTLTPDYYPPVPRSLPHDTAVSFVLTDHTHPSQPRFVISCALEHVELAQGMLAPAGSRRVLSARGSSGCPRGGDMLRSMLLDGTPNIELALHHHVRSGGGVGGSHGEAAGSTAPGPSNPPSQSFSSHQSSTAPDPAPGNANGQGGVHPPVEAGGGAPGFGVPMAWIPGVPVPQSGWYGSSPPGHGSPPFGNP